MATETGADLLKTNPPVRARAAVAAGRRPADRRIRSPSLSLFLPFATAMAWQILRGHQIREAVSRAFSRGGTFAPMGGVLANHPFNDLTSAILKSAIEVHRHLGPGLLESAYCACLAYELTAAGLAVQAGIKVPLVYKGVQIDCSYVLDLVVNDTVIIELKSVSQIAWIHKAQLLTYLRLTGCPAGLLINFNVPVLKDGVSRVLNTP